MAKELTEEVPAAAELFKKAEEILGYDLLDVCVNGPAEKLNSTAVSQPAIYVSSLAAIEKLRAQEGGQEVIDSCNVAAGLSLGEYTALTFAGALTFEDGLKLVKVRGESMQAAADATPSGMASVIGLDKDKVGELCAAANADVAEGEGVEIANFLCPGNYAVSGGIPGIEAVEAKAKPDGCAIVYRAGRAQQQTGAAAGHKSQPGRLACYYCSHVALQNRREQHPSMRQLVASDTSDIPAF